MTSAIGQTEEAIDSISKQKTVLERSSGFIIMAGKRNVKKEMGNRRRDRCRKT